VSGYVINAQAIKYITLFESVTNSKVKDCIFEQDSEIVQSFSDKNQQSFQPFQQNERVIFVTEEAQAGKAIGKHGRNIKMIEDMIKKKVKIIEFNPDIAQFIRNALYPVQANEIKQEEKMVHIIETDRNNKRVLLGRDQRNLNFLIAMVKRYFDIEGIKVVLEIVDKGKVADCIIPKLIDTSAVYRSFLNFIKQTPPHTNLHFVN